MNCHPGGEGVGKSETFFMANKVGKKPRDGQFGACLDEKAGQLVVFSARPGGRLWEVKQPLWCG